MSWQGVEPLRVGAIAKNVPPAVVNTVEKPELQRTDTTLARNAALKARRWMIDPRSSRFFRYWEMITSSALVYVALVTPFEVGFLEDTATFTDPFFVINLIITLGFILDCALQFFLMVEMPTSEGTVWVSHPSRVARRYLSGWFAVDFLSITLPLIDIVMLACSTWGGAAPDPTLPDSSLRDLRIFRVLRALRAIKLVKLVTGSRFIKRWEVKTAINYPALSLLKCIVGLLLLSHWFACIWGLQANLATNKLDTWLGGNAGVCVEDIDSAYGVDCLGPGDVYVAALYWAVMTITSIGYGDIAATPRNVTEQAIATMLMTIGAIGWGLVLGTIVSNLSDLDPEGDAFSQTMSELNQMMARESLPNHMRIRLREYFHKTQHVRETTKRRQLLDLMSPTLQAEVAWECSKSFMKRIWFLEGTSFPFRVQLSMSLQGRVFAPGELFPIGPLYIVHRGIALCGGMVRVKGQVWGDDIILSSLNLRLQHSARAINFVEVFTITRKALEAAVIAFPGAARDLRRKAVRLATRRAFIIEARRRRQERMELEGRTDAVVREFSFLHAASHVHEDDAAAVRLQEQDAPREMTGRTIEGPPKVAAPDDEFSADPLIQGVGAFFGFTGTQEASAREIRAAIKPMITKLLDEQQSLRREQQAARASAELHMAKQREEMTARMTAMASDVQMLRQWVENDVLVSPRLRA